MLFNSAISCDEPLTDYAVSDSCKTGGNIYETLTDAQSQIPDLLQKPWASSIIYHF